MPFTRRSLLSVVAAGAMLPALAHAAEDPRRTERAIGKPDAKVTVLEFFSLTCTHCAHFANTTFPQVKSQLIDTGKVRLVYHDFPLDQVALTAAMVARSLPEDQYEPFIAALFANQDRWAFSRQNNPTDEIWKTAALAGMSRAAFDAAIADTGLKNWIVAQQTADTDKYAIDSTPTFVVNGKKAEGAIGFDDFNKLVAAAS
jgi:protein-disulfide isomerase